MRSNKFHFWKKKIQRYPTGIVKNNFCIAINFSYKYHCFQIFVENQIK